MPVLNKDRTQSASNANVVLYTKVELLLAILVVSQPILIERLVLDHIFMSTNPSGYENANYLPVFSAVRDNNTGQLMGCNINPSLSASDKNLQVYLNSVLPLFDDLVRYHVL